MKSEFEKEKICLVKKALTMAFFYCALYVDFGPVIRTTDPDVMKREISKLEASGGGDVPEMCLSGLHVLKP